MFHYKIILTYTLYVDSFPLSLTRSLTEIDCIYRQHNACLIRSRNCLPFASTCIHPSFLVGFWLLIFLVLFCTVLLCVFTFLVPCCDVRYDFAYKRCSVPSFHPVVYRRAHILFMLYVFICGQWCPSHIVQCILLCLFSSLIVLTFDPILFIILGVKLLVGV